MNNEKNLNPEVVATPEVKRTQKTAWWLIVAGMLLPFFTRLSFAAPLTTLVTLVAFVILRKVASNQIVELVCKRMVWAQAALALILFVSSAMWIRPGGDMMLADLGLLLGMTAEVWCYSALARSKTLSDENIGWLNVIVTLIIVKALCISVGDSDFMEAYIVISLAWTFMVAFAWHKLIHSEAFVGKDLMPTAVEASKAFKVVNKYTILSLVPVAMLVMFYCMWYL